MFNGSRLVINILLKYLGEYLFMIKCTLLCKILIKLQFAILLILLGHVSNHWLKDKLEVLFVELFTVIIEELFIIE